MNCSECIFYEDGYMWNRCNLMEAEYFKTTNDCWMIDDNYMFKVTVKELGFEIGKLAFGEGGED
jgi:hypothetical protein